MMRKCDLCEDETDGAYLYDVGNMIVCEDCYWTLAEEVYGTFERKD